MNTPFVYMNTPFRTSSVLILGKAAVNIYIYLCILFIYIYLYIYLCMHLCMNVFH